MIVGDSVPCSGTFEVRSGPRGAFPSTVTLRTYQLNAPLVTFTLQYSHEPSVRVFNAAPQRGQCSAFAFAGGGERISRWRSNVHRSITYQLSSPVAVTSVRFASYSTLTITVVSRRAPTTLN